MELSISQYDTALSQWTRGDHHEEWVILQSNLGNVCANRLLGGHVANINHGIACYESALTALTAEGHPSEWSRACIHSWSEGCQGMQRVPSRRWRIFALRWLCTLDKLSRRYGRISRLILEGRIYDEMETIRRFSHFTYIFLVTVSLELCADIVAALRGQGS